MATVFKRKQSKNFYCEFTDPHGKRVLKSTGTRIKKEADEFATNLEKEVRRQRKAERTDQTNPELLEVIMEASQKANQGKLSETETRKLLSKIYRIANGKELRSFTIEGWLAHWLEAKRPSIGDSTFARYQNTVKSILSFLGLDARRDLSQLTSEHVEAYKKHLGNDSTRASYKNHKLLDFRRIIKAAHDEKLIEERVGQTVELFPEDDSQIRAPFTEEEIKTLLGRADENWKAIVTLGYHTGLRIGDIVKMKWESVKLAENRIVLTPQKQSKAKGRKGMKKVRIPMTASVRRALQDRQRLKGNSGKEEFVFPSLASKAKSVPSFHFSRLMEKAGVPKEITYQDDECTRSFHSLRHSFVTFLANADIPVEVRQELAAHASKEVHGLYTHRNDEKLAEAMQSFGDLNAA